ncbi:acetyl-CoA C-acetyltransferase [Planctomycetota bacterium]
MSDIFIIDGRRTPCGKFNGAFAAVPAAGLGERVVESLLKEHSLVGEAVDECLFGNVLQAGSGQNVARQIALGADMSKESTALTVNMVCGSGLRTVAMAAQSITSGDAELVIAGGTENMSMAPFLLEKARTGLRMGHAQLTDSMIKDGLWDVFGDCHMGITAEHIAEKYGISREEQDAFAAASQNKTEAAMAGGAFDNEIISVEVPVRKGAPLIIKEDESPRKGVTTETLAGLKPAFKDDGTVTAGNASTINDGAAAVIVAGQAAIDKYGLVPAFRIAGYAWCGCDPAVMGLGPIKAVAQALSKAGWSLGDLDLIESNEAFAVQSLAIGREFGWDDTKVNVNGGAIALGHPIGASGARILVTLMHAMHNRDAGKGLATLCIGGGMGIAMCIEEVS